MTPDLPTLPELLAVLDREHVPDEFFYRGQVTYYGRFQFSNSQGDVFEVEKIMPSDVRFWCHHPTQQSLPVRQLSEKRLEGRNLRDRFTSFLLEIGGQSIENKRTSLPFLHSFCRERWHHIHVHSRYERIFGSEMTDEQFLRLARKHGFDGLKGRLERLGWSLAQHYGIATALLDVTFDPHVAAWFASNPWNPAERPPSANDPAGVIFRFNRDLVERILAVWYDFCKDEGMRNGWSEPPQFFFEDIRHIPVSFASRPRAQSGASIYGFDQLQVLQWLERYSAIEVFRFRHSDEPCILSCSRASLIPDTDSFLALVSEFKSIQQRSP